VIGRFLDRLAPPVLGRDFRWLWGATATSNIGDGILLSAGPLLVTTITREPLAVAAAAFLQQLPWIVVGIPAGAVVDRIDRRRLVIGVNATRAAVLATLGVSIATGTVSLGVVYIAMFLLGTAETFADNASTALVATTVDHDHLGLANSRLTGTWVVANELAGPPIGALLFGLGLALPFAVDAILILCAATLVARLATPVRAAAAAARETHILEEIAEGIRWLVRHPPVRALALTIFAFNVTFGAAMAVYVLLAKERLGLDDIGYGLLITAGAIGGIVGSASYPRLERRFALATLMRGGLLLETITHLILATTTSPIVAGATMTLFGVHAVIWGTTSTSVRQRAVPESLMGRVTSVYMLAMFGGFAAGTVVGGVIAQQFGITAPYWFGFVGSAVLLILIWRTLDDIAHAPPAAQEDAATA
jgi:MFS family permease